MKPVDSMSLRDHALFIAFAPVDKPKIALAVLNGVRRPVGGADHPHGFRLLFARQDAGRASGRGCGCARRRRGGGGVTDIAGTLRYWARQSVAHIDVPLLAIACAILGVGILTVNSATFDGNNRALSQLLNAGVAFVIMWLVARLPPQKLMRAAVPLYVLGVVLLVCVFLFGVKVNGARRWLSLGFTRIQPSEIMKIAMPLMLAWYFSQIRGAAQLAALSRGCPAVADSVRIDRQATRSRHRHPGRRRRFYVIFFAGLPWKVMSDWPRRLRARRLCCGIPGTRLQRKRILTLLDPTTDPLRAGYHIIQATIAIGSAALGKGYLRGTQTHLEFIPEKRTDFIFAVFSEE